MLGRYYNAIEYKLSLYSISKKENMNFYKRKES